MSVTWDVTTTTLYLTRPEAGWPKGVEPPPAYVFGEAAMAYRFSLARAAQGAINPAHLIAYSVRYYAQASAQLEAMIARDDSTKPALMKLATTIAREHLRAKAAHGVSAV